MDTTNLISAETATLFITAAYILGAAAGWFTHKYRRTFLEEESDEA